MAVFKREAVTIIDPQLQLKTFTITKTKSGKPKDKLFCGQCGSTIGTIPMLHDGKVFNLRSSLIDSGFEIFQPNFPAGFREERESFFGPSFTEDPAFTLVRVVTQ
jgi:hypothetical protein